MIPADPCALLHEVHGGVRMTYMMGLARRGAGSHKVRRFGFGAHEAHARWVGTCAQGFGVCGGGWAVK